MTGTKRIVLINAGGRCSNRNDGVNGTKSPVLGSTPHNVCALAGNRNELHKSACARTTNVPTGMVIVERLCSVGTSKLARMNLDSSGFERNLREMADNKPCCEPEMLP